MWLGFQWKFFIWPFLTKIWRLFHNYLLSIAVFYSQHFIISKPNFLFPNLAWGPSSYGNELENRGDVWYFCSLVVSHVIPSWQWVYWLCMKSAKCRHKIITSQISLAHSYLPLCQSAEVLCWQQQVQSIELVVSCAHNPQPRGFIQQPDAACG